MQPSYLWTSPTLLSPFYLKEDKNDREKAIDCVENIKAVWMKVNDKVGYELQEVVDKRPNTKYKGTLPQKTTSMRFHIVIGSGRFYQYT